ncbi:hypothetical protein OHC33_007833 [Knufia fluminis]|uniref:Uncharacterized protein n=1 Tax=Knufia fluminis TaxID=191047 RepID=A0AAN8I5J6_9EURO|nr:hypothetical protein OHC33_007833 [Knufia fluminis]
MASYHDHHDQPPSPPQDLSASGLTIPSDSEPYSSISPPSSSPPDSSNNNGGQPVIIYQPPTVFPLHRGRGTRAAGPGVEIRDDPVERRRRNGTPDPGLWDTTSLE